MGLGRYLHPVCVYLRMPPASAPKTLAYSFEPKAYAKAVMHICKHSSVPVLGVFIGRTNQKTIKIIDTIPLFHTHSLAPMLKIALMLIEQHCSDAGLEILGFYSATVSGNPDLGQNIRALGEKIYSNYGAACIWAFNSKAQENRFALQGMYYAKEEWKMIQDPVAIKEVALKTTSMLIREMRHLDVVDFDDHLMNVKLNWLNSDLFRGEAWAESAMD